MKKAFINEFVQLYVPTLTLVSYTVQTYDNINSVFIYNYTANNTTNINIGINNPDYLTGTYYIRGNESYTIGGNYNEKLNAPVIIYADNIGANNPPGFVYIIIKRYV